jgi:hypothetical protein
LVKEELVHRYFENQDPLGKRIQVDREGAAPAIAAWASLAMAGIVASPFQLSRELSPPIVSSAAEQKANNSGVGGSKQGGDSPQAAARLSVRKSKNPNVDYAYQVGCA